MDTTQAEPTSATVPSGLWQLTISKRYAPDLAEVQQLVAREAKECGDTSMTRFLLCVLLGSTPEERRALYAKGLIELATRESGRLMAEPDEQ